MLKRLLEQMKKVSKSQKKCSILCLIFFVSAVSLFGQKSDATLAAAATAYNQFKLDESRVILNTIISSSQSSDSQKAEALQNLATQDWKIFRNLSQATKHLEEALLFEINAGKTYLLLGQIHLEAKKIQDSYAFAAKAIAGSSSEQDKLNASLLKAEIIHNEAYNQILLGEMPNRQKLLEASDLLKYVLSKQPGRPKPSELSIGISLFRKNGADLLNDWKSYFFITNEQNINQALLPSYTALKSVLPNFNGNQDLAFTDRKKIIEALAYSQFYDYASLLATSRLFGSDAEKIRDEPGIAKIIQFQEFIQAIKDVNEYFYPKIGSGLKNYETDYNNAITKAAKELWIHMEKGNTIGNYNEDLFFSQIKKYYNADGYIGTTVGYHSLLLGLIIHNETKEIDQYGYKADFSYISITRLISKDFTSWYGATNVGGWGTEFSMVQVRDAYLNDPFTRLSWMTDPIALTAIEKQIADSKISDLIKCKENKYADPSFLAPYLRLKESGLIFAHLKKSGLKDTELYLAFISESIRLSIEATIFAHEGRHAVDQLFFKSEFDTLSHDERELRAKFSEVVFSSNPKLALTGSIFGSHLDETTHHGKANYRFRKIMVDWMEAHHQEIRNLNNDIPLIMQVDLLSAEQIVAICTLADPLYQQRK
jgi:hypothetical protein